MRNALNRILIVLDAFFRGFRSGRTNNKTILIVFQQIFGDAVVLQDSLLQYTKIFAKMEGYDVRLLARSSVLSFMKETLPLPIDMKFEVVDFEKFLKSYRYYRQVVKKYKGKAGTILVPGTSLSAEIFTMSSDANRKVGLVRCKDVKKPWVMSYFYKNAYTETVKPDKEDMMLQRHRKLINYLGKMEYKAGLPELLFKNRIIDKRYAVICPGSSKKEKCWPVERFAEIADYIIEQYGFEIHLCGGADEEKYAYQMIQKMKSKNIVSHIGKTSFSDWSSIIQHAELVLGNDSATVHLAAAARVPCICIAGVYDKYQFFPYKIDVGNGLLPVTVMKDMPCEWCRTIGYRAGFGNKHCQKRINSGFCSSCIDLIKANDVKKAIENLMKEEKE